MKQYLNVCRLNDMLGVRGYDHATKQYFMEKVAYTPTMFIRAVEPTQYQSLDGQYLTPKVYHSMSVANKKIKEASEQGYPIYGMDDFVCAYMNAEFDDGFDASKVRTFYIDIEARIEKDDGTKNGFPNPYEAPSPVTAITIYDTLTQTYHLFADVNWKNTNIKHLKVEFHHCDNEQDLLKSFLVFWCKNYPNIVTGWSVDRFDIPYLYNRLQKVFNINVANKLSPWSNVQAREYTLYNRPEIDYTLSGISIVDYLKTYKKNTFHKQERYKLDFISNVELGKGKLDYRDEGYADLDDLYTRNPQMFLDYNVTDVERVVEIDNKNRFMDIVIGTAYYSKVNFHDVYSVLKCWDSLIHNFLYKQNIVTSPKSRIEKHDKFVGAYVKEPKPGLYNWVVTFDLASLYPSIIISGNLGIESMVSPGDFSVNMERLHMKDLRKAIINKELDLSELKEHGLSLLPNGVLYNNENQSMYSILANNILEERKQFKADMLEAKKLLEAVERKPESYNEDIPIGLKNIITSTNNKQLVAKVLANSLYGAMGNNYNRYYDLRLAQSITYMGQVVIQWIEKKTNDYMNEKFQTKDVEYVLYSDTDSCFVSFEKLVQEHFGDDLPETNVVVDFIDSFIKETFEDQINQWLVELADYLNLRENHFKMKREVISNSTIFSAKKRYAMSVIDNEGVRYNQPHHKIMGLEIVRSTIPIYTRTKIKEALIMILNGCSESDILDFVDKVRADFKTHPNLDDIAFNTGVHGMEKYFDPVTIFKKKTPIYCRGALLYNHYFSSDSPIKSGDDIRYMYLKLPNPIKQDVIAWNDKFPKDLLEFVDLDTTFDKLFLTPLERLTTLLMWDIRNESFSLF